MAAHVAHVDYCEQSDDWTSLSTEIFEQIRGKHDPRLIGTVEMSARVSNWMIENVTGSGTSIASVFLPLPQTPHPWEVAKVMQQDVRID